MSERMTEAEEWAPIRRMRVRYLDWHQPKVWAVYFDQPGRECCYCHAKTLEDAWKALSAYFAGMGHIKPLRVDPRFLKATAHSEKGEG